jgi:hypothetical protein
MSNQRKLLNKRILIIAALLSGIASAAYAGTFGAHSVNYSFWLHISYIGMPGILLAAAVSIALLGGAHGGGPLGMLLLIATPINFLLYVGLGIAAQSVGKIFRKKNGQSA